MSPSPRADRLRPLGLVAAGGVAGAVLRWLLDGWLGAGAGYLPGVALPLGTLAANVLAAALLGAVLSAPRRGPRFGPETRLLVGTGFCGSLSTYSTFAAETATRAPVVASAYVVLTYALGFAAVIAGDRLARWRS